MGTLTFEIDYSDNALYYVDQHTSDILTVADLLGVSALGIAGSIAREITAANAIYNTGDSTWLFNAQDLIRAVDLGLIFCNDALAADYITSLSDDITRDGPFGYLNKLVLHPDIDDIGPGRINISTAISELLRYQSPYPGAVQMSSSKVVYANIYTKVLSIDTFALAGDRPVKIAPLVARLVDFEVAANLRGTAEKTDRETAAMPSAQSQSTSEAVR